MQKQKYYIQHPIDGPKKKSEIDPVKLPSNPHQSELVDQDSLAQASVQDATTASDTPVTPQAKTKAKPIQPYLPRHARRKPCEKWHLWDYLTADDATRVNFCHWVCANEVRFTYGLFVFSIGGIALVLILFHLLNACQVQTISNVSPNLKAITLPMIIAAVLSLIPLLWAYAMFYEQSRTAAKRSIAD